MKRLALISVSDKTGIVEFAQQLVSEFDFDIVSSGGTAKKLIEAGIEVTKVSDYTGSPEILGGRVKTLHPRIHGGILARRDRVDDQADMEANDVRPFDLIVVNLYPFVATISKPDVTVAEAVENIDIGGPAMLRAAAKNYQHLTVISNPKRYEAYLEELRSTGGQPSLNFRQTCALETFTLTADYDQAISSYLAGINEEKVSPLPPQYSLMGTQRQALRYGENPHQSATWYQTGNIPTGWAGATQLQGKELSYNNLVDLEAARRIINEFTDKPTAAILKHTNPCGIASADHLVDAYESAFAGDSVSVFGGIVALNQPIDEATATAMTKTFLECVVAPGCNEEAKAVLAKKSNLRVLISPDLQAGPKDMVKVIAGGFLVQTVDDEPDSEDKWEVVTEKQPTAEQLAEMMFAWKAAKHVKSNAIVITRDRATIGIGAGQMNRVGAVEIALKQAGEKTQGATLASDGFFPFDDSVRTAAKAGITTIIQPGGSRRDEDSIQAANELGIVMILTGTRHFLH
ncbi:MAG: bifunctional phosphoribosylaminoimidazolecarboxamide formyltransferase/IMP cyclohydrolase [Halothece sp. Uz-M2-17]|nr:bifunctional phosphoribosylaminoimidazolecarboxamide formyltransferase/IMP cyclohydrolase [Halothece sp. Uz-M2-17]